MTQAIVVRHARCRDRIVGMRAGSQAHGKTDQRSGDAKAAIAIEGYLGRHCLGPASVRDKAVGATIIPRRLYAPRNTVDSIDAAQQISRGSDALANPSSGREKAFCAT